MFSKEEYNYLPIDQGEDDFNKQWTKIKGYGVIFIDGFQTDSEVAYILHSINPEAMKILIVDDHLSFLQRKKSKNNIWGIEINDCYFQDSEPINQLILKEEV